MFQVNIWNRFGRQFDCKPTHFVFLRGASSLRVAGKGPVWLKEADKRSLAVLTGKQVRILHCKLKLAIGLGDGT